MQCETVEIAQIELRPVVTEEAFPAAFQQSVDGFARQQPGFLNRELPKKVDGQFLNLAHWATRSDTAGAFDRSCENAARLAFLGLLEADETGSSSGVEYGAEITPEPAMQSATSR